MSNFLPNISKNNSSAVHANERARREQWRAVNRVCGSTIGHEGYLQMLQTVRKQFLDPAAQASGSQLPPIYRPRAPSREKAASSTSILRFSQGLNFKLDDINNVTDQRGTVVPQASLLALEEEERQYLRDMEIWERRVLNQMMVVSYVTFVLREEMDELHYCEREKRANIVFEEEKGRFWLRNESDIGRKLAGYKIILRAKEEKQRRLEEADVLYPITSSNRASKVFRAPKEEQDARKILQHYVRMKHSLGAINTTTTTTATTTTTTTTPTPTAAAASAAFGIFNEPSFESNIYAEEKQLSGLRLKGTKPLSSHRFQTRSNLRNVVGIASYVGFLQKDAEARKMIAQCEKEEFEGILSLFQEQKSLLLAWRNRCMHLERLLYWKEQEEQRREQVQLALQQHVMSFPMRHVSERDEFASCEEEEREKICIEEDVCRGYLRDEYRNATFQKRLSDLEHTFEASLSNILEDEVIARQVCLQLFELSLRVTFAEQWEEELFAMVPSQIALLQLLNEYMGNHINEIVIIQRAVRRWRGGKLGWHATHREIGRLIQANRDTRKIKRGLEMLHSFKESLLVDCKAIEAEILASHKAAREDLFYKEDSHRAVIVSQEKWLFCTLRREKKRDLLENIVLPKMLQCDKEEVDLRRELYVAEEFERELLLGLFASILHVMEGKQDAVASETFERTELLLEEAKIFCQILSDELDEREVLRIDAEEREANLENERRTFVTTFLNIRQKQCEEHERRINEFMWICKARALELEATNVEVRNMLMKSFLLGLSQLFEEMSLKWLSEYSLLLQLQHKRLLCGISFDIFLKTEESTRSCIVEEEKSAMVEIVRVMYEEVDDKLRNLQKVTRAANIIKRFYNSYKNGKVGRSGLRNYLREAFAYKSEGLEQDRIRQKLKEEVQRYKEKLEEEMQQCCLEKQKQIQFMINVLETKTEPRERAELERMENMIFRIISCNVSSFKAIEKEPNHLEVLMQLESYERVTIKNEWKRMFVTVFEQQKTTLFLDMMAEKVQHCWRRYIKRKKLCLLIDKFKKQLFCEEKMRRAELEIEELTHYVYEIIKPMMACTFMLGYLINDVPQFLEHMCFKISYSLGIEEDEWRNRMLLLWKMRHSSFEKCILSTEALTRSELEQNHFYNVMEQIEFMNEEGTIRDALWNERCLFLLRVLVKAEREFRLVIMEEFDRFSLSACESKERYLIQKEKYEPSAKLLYVECVMGLLAVIADEEARERQMIATLFNN